MPNSDQPNILIIQADQHRADCIGAYGNTDIQTPHIDALAAAYGVYDRARDQHWPDPPAALTTWSHPRDIKAPCPNCETKMTAIRIRSRGTYFCSKCQV